MLMELPRFGLWITLTVGVSAYAGSPPVTSSRTEGSVRLPAAREAGLSLVGDFVDLGGAGAGDRLSVNGQAPTFYKARCAACHGETGKGDGPGAAACNPKPPNFRSPAWQASVSDEQLRKATLEGGPAVGKSPAMPSYPALRGKPELMSALVQIIREMKD